MKRTAALSAKAAGLLLLLGQSAFADTPPKFSADIPAKITTPESVETSIGTLTFKNGAPDAKTAELVYDNLDRMRGVEVFLTGISATSVRAACNGLAAAGVAPNKALGITEDMMDHFDLYEPVTLTGPGGGKVTRKRPTEINQLINQGYRPLGED